MEFSDLALAKLLQTAPELGPFILNFSEVTEEMEAQVVKVGVFILRTGAGIAFIPVITKDESVFPIDSVFLEDEGRFLPLTPGTIKKLLTASPESMGRAKNPPKSVIGNPDLTSLINPPKTGKYVYASSSRLIEFLADLPPSLQSFTMEKIAGEQSVYQAMDKMFGLKAIFSVLRNKTNQSGTPMGGKINSTGTGPAGVKKTTFSVLTTPQEVRNLMDEALAADFLRDGFAIHSVGDPAPSRVAVAYQSYNSDGVYQTVDPTVDGGRDYKIAMADGSSKYAFVPKYHKLNQVLKDSGLISIFEDGSYARGCLVSIGEGLPDASVMKNLFDLSPPKLLKDCFREDNIMIFTNTAEVLGPFRVTSVVLNSDGVDLEVMPAGGSSIRRIKGSRNLKNEAVLIGETLFVQYNVLVLTLGPDVTFDVERNAQRALDTRQLITGQFLGAELNLRHDGVEFSINGKSAGLLPTALKTLVEEEHLDPDVAQSFLKQASETTFLKVFLSKKAAATSGSPTPTEIPEYGMKTDDASSVAMNGAFMPAVSAASGLGDGQVLEATVISQLLQSPDLYEKIEEYLPDIKASVDKLGRLLFLSRVKIDQLVEGMDSDSVFALISQIKGVYRQLGDSCTRLEQVSNTSRGFQPDAKLGTPAGNGV